MRTLKALPFVLTLNFISDGHTLIPATGIYLATARYATGSETGLKRISVFLSWPILFGENRKNLTFA